MSKVLLVEDDNNLREIYEARLAAEGYEIVTAKDGEDALAVAKQHKPDLIISDVMMPRISGFEMLDILRNTDGLKNVKIVMLTALGQNDDRTRADNLGADRYLVKSQVTLEDIVKTAEELLDPDYVPPAPGGDNGSAQTPGVTPNTSGVPAATAAPGPQPEAAPPAPPSEPQQPAADPAPAAAPDPTAPQVDNPAQTQVAPAPAAVPDPVAPAPAQPTDNQQPPTAPVESQTPPVPEPTVSPQPQEQPELTLPTIPTGSTPQQPVTSTDSGNQSADAASPAVPTPSLTVPQPAPVATEQPSQDPTAPQDISPSLTGTDPTQPDSGIPVIEQDVTVQEASPEVTTDAEPKIQMPTAPDTALVDGAQTTSQESAAVEQQINDFVQNQNETPPPLIDDSANPPAPSTPEVTEPQSDDASSDSSHEELISSAMNDLLSGSEQSNEAPAANPVISPEAAEPQAVDAPASVTPAPEATETNQPQPATSNNQIAGKKMIHPISAPDKQANINDLAAQEEIKENMEKGVTGATVVADTTQPQQPTEPGVTPTPPPQVTPQPAEPGGVFTPNTDGSANENAL